MVVPPPSPTPVYLSSPGWQATSPSTTTEQDDSLESSSQLCLAARMRSHALTRSLAFQRLGEPMEGSPPSSAGWFRTVFTMRGRALSGIVLPFTVINAVSVAWTCAAQLYLHDNKWDLPSNIESAYALIITTLGFLLVFRLNRAAKRYWDSREKWGKLVELGRLMACSACVHLDREQADAVCALTCLFAVATKQLLRSDSTIDVEQLAGIFTSADYVRKVASAAHPPLRVAAELRRMLADALAVDASTTAALGERRSTILRTLEGYLDGLVGQCGGMERIRSTPLPIVYVSHLRSYLLIALLLMPFVFEQSWLWGTIPTVALVSVAFLGVESAASECESPFQLRPNHLKMEAFCHALFENVSQILVDSLDDARHNPHPPETTNGENVHYKRAASMREM